MSVYVFRVDGSLKMGIGHIMRSLALAQALYDLGHRILYATAEMPCRLRDRLINVEGFEVHSILSRPGSVEDAKELGQIASGADGLWIVLDGYHFEEDFQRILHNMGILTLEIDDHRYSVSHMVDVIVNQGLELAHDSYSNVKEGSALLLGSRYALIRRELREKKRDLISSLQPVKNILVTFGGSDFNNVSNQVVKALQLLCLAEVDKSILIGPSNPHLTELEDAVSGDSSFKLLSGTWRMEEILPRIDLAITAGGTTCWELAYFGVPSLMIITAENQSDFVDTMDGISGKSLGWYHGLTLKGLADEVLLMMSSQRLRSQFSEAGMKLVDGLGAHRVVEFMTNRQKEKQIATGSITS